MLAANIRTYRSGTIIIQTITANRHGCYWHLRECEYTLPFMTVSKYFHFHMQLFAQLLFTLLITLLYIRMLRVLMNTVLSTQ